MDRNPMKQFAVYILASRMTGTLYIGVTSNLVRRMHQHRDGTASAFTRKYRVHRLVHFELYDRAEPALQREKSLKHWSRAWKIQLIEKLNPDWRDLYEEICGQSAPHSYPYPADP
jgi:putative endonuclease